MSVASPSVPPTEGELAVQAGRARARRRRTASPSTRPPHPARAASVGRASVRPAALEPASPAGALEPASPAGAVEPASRAETLEPASRAEARGLATPDGRAIETGDVTLVYLDPRTLEAKTLTVPIRSRAIAAATCVILFVASTALGFVTSAALTAAEPGRVFSMRVLRAPALHSMFTSIPGLDASFPRLEPDGRREPDDVVRGRVERLGLGTNAAASQLIGGVARPEWVREAAAGAPQIDTLHWPVDDGWFVRGYGSGTGAYHLAVDVGAPTGYRVRAAAPGIVAYADDEIRGFGNLLLLVHPNGWITLYAHNSRHHVAVGERVRAGQLIAEVGSTGISRGPHVHFELLHGGKNCDPAPLFRPGMRHRDGDLSEVAQADWDVAAGRPAQIRCDRRRIHPHSARLRGNGDELDAHDPADAEIDAPSASLRRAAASTEG